MNLPSDYLAHMSQLLGEEYEDFLLSYENNSKAGIRVNTNKITVSDFMKIAPYRIEKIPFVEDGFYIDATDSWSKHPYYYAGLYYIQEPSAMLPADRLPINEGDFVLDLCAAPGGKSTKLSTKELGVLVSNDISYSRTIPLVKNLEMFGIKNILVTSENPVKLATIYVEAFDKIIVDAPCSGEGMFRKDSDLIKAWQAKGPEGYVETQKEIIECAYKMLKPGGMLMYSTCTFSEKEDEEVILDLISKHDDLEIEDIANYESFSYGYKKYSDINIQLAKCVHIFPHKMQGEGHFMTLIHKQDKGDNITGTINNGYAKFIEYDKLPKSILDFLKSYKGEAFDTIKESVYHITNDGMIFLISNGTRKLLAKNVRYVRTGLLVGAINKYGKFIPHTAFALAFDMKDYDNACNLVANDFNVIKYLKGETLPSDVSDNLKKGIVLMCVDGFALGYAQNDGNKLKNLYEKGWRLN